MEEDGDVPALEDMSEVFSNYLKLREEKSNRKVTKSEILEVPQDAEKMQAQRIEKLLGKDDGGTVGKDEVVKKSSEKPVAPNSYCGFKKGFFSASAKQNSKKQTDKRDQVPLVSKKIDENKNVFPEVQQAINQQMPFLKSNDWVTEDLLTKIMSHPKLSKQFMDPRFSNAIQMFQSNPEQVMRMCESNSELKEFIQEFCAIMGEHFTTLGEKQDQKGMHSMESLSENGRKAEVYPEDEKKMKSILSDPEVVAILNTGEIQELLRVLKEEPEKATRLLRSADAVLRQKIQKLVDVGLLQMAV